MARKKLDDDDFEDFDDNILEEEVNESNLESALQPRDYTGRRILLLELDDSHRHLTIEALQEMLTGAVIGVAKTIEEGLVKLENEEWDTFVLDLQEPTVSYSDFVKQVNNLPDTMVISIPFPTLVAGETRNRVKLEPLRKLFDIEKPKPKAQ